MRRLSTSWTKPPLTASQLPEHQGSVAVFPTVADAAASSVAAAVVWLQTLGYHSPGDGGGGSYRPVGKAPKHGGWIKTADGRCWALIGNAPNVRQFGARGDGVTDDSQAIQAALNDPQALSLHFPAGTYRAIGLNLTRSCSLTGDGAELVWDEPEPNKDLLRVSAGNFFISKLRFRGAIYKDLDTPVAPATLLRIFSKNDDEIANVRILDCDFVGGLVACAIGIVTDVLIERIRFEHCRNYGLTLLRGPRNIIVRGLIARNIGTYGGVKTGIHGTTRATENLVITDFVISDCGKLHANPGNAQEGIDLACGFARQWVISNGVISDCGGGGIELKVSDIVADPSEVFEDIVISRVVVNLIGDMPAIKFNWHGPRSEQSGKQGRRILIEGNIFRHREATRGPGAGIILMAWSDITILNNRIEGSRTGILMRALGASDDSASRIHIGSNVIHGVAYGIEARAGTFRDLRITGNDIHAETSGVHFEGAELVDIEIDHNTMVQSSPPGASSHSAGVTIFDNAAGGQAANLVLHGNWITARGGHAVEIAARGSEGRVFNNILTSHLAPVRIAGGAWEIVSNHFFAEYPGEPVQAADSAAITQAFNFDRARPSPAGKPRHALPRPSE